MLIPEPREPVPGLGLKFRWNEGAWESIFDKQKELIRRDIRRARADRKLVVYLSCPISGRAGGHEGTNVEVARFTERHLLDVWGERFWILNPCQYQLESREGRALLEDHATAIGVNIRKLYQEAKPAGGDYMRMWTKVLVEDGWLSRQPGAINANDPALDSGRCFDGFYFLGPSDVHKFFKQHGATSLTAGIEQHFARKFAVDAEFRDYYEIPGIDWKRPEPTSNPEPSPVKEQWEKQRQDYLLFYSLRASINYSLGSHDEWLLFTRINQRRRAAGGLASQLPAFFDGRQLDPAAAESPIAAGYSSS